MARAGIVIEFSIMGVVMEALEDDLVVERFRAAVLSAYGERVQRVVLYGSRARGDARPGSDYDIAVFLNAIESRWTEMKRLADIDFEIMNETGMVVNAMPFDLSALDDRTMFMHELRRDGKDII